MLETQVAISYAFASCILRERVAEKTREKGKTKAAASGVGCPWDFHMKGRNGGSLRQDTVYSYQILSSDGVS